MVNLSAHKPLRKSHSLTNPHRSFTSLKTLPAAHSLAQFSLAEVAHFLLAPKVSPAQAYEWDNFRLCRSRLNGRKDSYQDVLDPFALAPGWFNLDFRTFFLVPNPTLPPLDRSRVEATIERLQLNIDSDYVNERIGVIREYCLGRATFAQLLNRYPFIAAEMRVQNFDANFLPRWRAFFVAQP